MNPVLVFLILLGAVVLWFLLATEFRDFGGIAKHFLDNVKDAMSEDNENEERK